LRLSQHLWSGWLRPLLFEGDDRHARDFLEILLALDPEDAAAHEALGAIHWRAGRDSAAEKHYREALKLDPDKEYLRKRLGRAGRRRP
jgi:Flp pilus assembly protein TadD